MNPENIPNQTEKTAPLEQKIKKSAWKEVAKEIIIFAVVAFGVVLPFRMYIAEPYVVDGRSMDPTFATGDYLIVDKFSYRDKQPERNSVIVFKYPKDVTKSFIKRIIGLPGETVVEKGNVVMIINAKHPDGFEIDQSYVTHQSPSNFKKVLGENEYFVMGDNRAESFDSRSWGPLPSKDILGKPILRLFPINKIGIAPGADTSKALID